MQQLGEEEEQKTGEEMGMGSSCRAPYQDSFLCGPPSVLNRVTASSFSGALVAGIQRAMGQECK